MVALLEPRHDPSPTQRRTTPAARRPASCGHLRLVESPPREPTSRQVPVAGTSVVAVAVVVVFGLLAVVRLSQGAPPAATWVELGGDPRGTALALAGPGDHPGPSGEPGTVAREGEIYAVRLGDTYWSIAVELAPERDPRTTVDRLLEVNGGSSSLQAGQRIVIPSDLLTGEGSPASGSRVSP